MGLIRIVSAGLGDDDDAASAEETSKEDDTWLWFGVGVMIVFARTGPRVGMSPELD